jgi:hypothetical protein
VVASWKTLSNLKVNRCADIGFDPYDALLAYTPGGMLIFRPSGLFVGGQDGENRANL